jgi:hypothetical protein
MPIYAEVSGCVAYYLEMVMTDRRVVEDKTHNPDVPNANTEHYKEADHSI